MEGYDLFWVHPLKSATSDLKIKIGGNRVDSAKDSIPGVILFPALTTPDIVWGCLPGDEYAELGRVTPEVLYAFSERGMLEPMGLRRDDNAEDQLDERAYLELDDAKIELLIAFRKEDLEEAPRGKRPKGVDEKRFIRDRVSCQLKVSRGLDPLRKYAPDAIEVNGVEAEPCSKPKLEANGTYETHSRFRGILSAHAVKLYEKNGFSVVYKVRVSKRILRQAGGPQPCTKNELLDGSLIVPRPDSGNLAKTNQDFLVWNAVNNGCASMKNGHYGFLMAGDDVQSGMVDGRNPVQSYHPVFFFGPTMAAVNIGHMADIHLVSRQQILAKSQARVIEHGDFAGKTIGGMVNVCSRNIVSLFEKFRSDPEVHAIVIGGDVVDFNPGAFAEDPTGTPGVKEIWDMVDMGSGWKQRYHENVDLLSVYSVIIHNYQQGNAKPVYLVSGNHDCYYSPFGISPRLFTGSRTNEGIPADHNLTFYEAILCFGPSATKLTKTGDPFDKDYFKWFYQVFTPFRDFSVELPKQILIGLRWGDAESLLLEGPSADQAGESVPLYKVGFLPRADHAVSDRQMGLIEPCLGKGKKGKKVILASHFTFTSYKETLSEAMANDAEWGDNRKEGDIYFNTYSLADMGTFETNRTKMFKKILTEDRSIHCVLTGHSHRRGLYTLRQGIATKWVGYNSVKTDFHVFPTTQGTGGSSDWAWPPPRRNRQNPDGSTNATCVAPWIIVSDSGGSVPRRNIAGEFKGLGSDRPSGTKVVFNSEGEVVNVRSVPVNIRGAHEGKPRIAVALDYYDIMCDEAFLDKNKGKVVVKDIASVAFAAKDEYGDRRPSLTFRVDLAAELNDNSYRIELAGMTLYCRSRMSRDGWSKFAFARKSNWQVHGDVVRASWGLDGDSWSDIRYFFKCMQKSESTNFLSLVFRPKPSESDKPDSPIAHYYDFESPWNFEVDLERDTSGILKWKTVSYRIKRVDKKREIPNHKARQEWYSEVYA
ncbi:MAG: metallophosphoesterase [Planctomycetes bacterium]|nr:metallophosphoesterase [Planctomycetota bacterium]